jgi:hypothetical protein
VQELWQGQNSIMSEKSRSFPMIREHGLRLGHSKILRLACEPLGQQNNIYSTNLHTRINNAGNPAERERQHEQYDNKQGI